MGSDPATSVVSLEGRCHELANLWIADASVFPGCPAVGPGLTVVANALRIGEANGGGCWGEWLWRDVGRGLKNNETWIFVGYLYS